MRVGVKISLGLSVLVAFAAPASAKECVEPYGELVQVSEFETVVRVKPECEAMQRAAIAVRTGQKPTEITLGSSMVLGEMTKSKASLIPALPDTGELAVSRRPVKRTVSCSDPAVCGRSRVAVVKKTFSCEDGRGYLVGISAGLTEVRIADQCRHLVNPKGPAVTLTVPNVLAPDWELDQTPEPKTRASRTRNNPNKCPGGGNCAGTGAAPQGDNASPTPAEQPSSGGFIDSVQAGVYLVEWRTADLYLGGDLKLIATRSRRYQPAARPALIG